MWLKNSQAYLTLHHLILPLKQCFEAPLQTIVKYITYSETCEDMSSDLSLCLPQYKLSLFDQALLVCLVHRLTPVF